MISASPGMPQGFASAGKGTGKDTMMTRRKTLAIFFVGATMGLPARADQAKSAFSRGAKAESQSKLDEAYADYKQAHMLKPGNTKYTVAYLRVRFEAAAEHVHTGQKLRDDGQLTPAYQEFLKAVEIDNTSFIAQQELRRTADMVRKKAAGETVAAVSPLAKAAEDVPGPMELQITSAAPITLRMNANSDVIYRTIAKLGGLNILFDSDFHAQKISVELNNVTVREALRLVAVQSKTFWTVEGDNTIMVAADTQTKRKELEANVMKTFYLKNLASTNELTEAANTLKSLLDLTRIQLIPAQDAMVLRGTPDQLVLAEKLLADIDKPKSEVVIDIAVMEVSREVIRTLGTNPPTSGNISIAPSGSSGGNGSALTINTLGSLAASNFLVTIPGASVSYLMSDSNTKVLQRPEIRALNDGKATLKIGDRVPIATGSYGAGIGAGGVSPLVNTQFQYIDVGVNIDITPHIHSAQEVTLKMSLEISSVTGQQNIGGITQPVIGQRRIEHETRLQDGDVSLVGGILEDSETQSLSGYPWLARIPILKYLFAQEDKDRRQNEVVFAITPHIIRSADISDQNLRVVDVGTGTNVQIRHKDSVATPAPTPASPAKPENPGAGPTAALPAKQESNPKASETAPRQ